MLTGIRAGKTPGTSGRRSVTYRSLSGRTYEGVVKGASPTIAITSAARASNLVIAQVADSTGIRVGKRVTIDLPDASFDGNFIVTVVNPTDIRWAQVAADAANAGGAGTLRVTEGLILELVSASPASRASRLRTHVGPAVTMKSVDSYFYSFGAPTATVRA